jgi:hypothetical protein
MALIVLAALPVSVVMNGEISQTCTAVAFDIEELDVLLAMVFDIDELAVPLTYTSTSKSTFM